MDLKKLEDGFFVTGQINPEQVAQAARLGVTMIINNRPDEEESGQPEGALIAAAAAEAGLQYRHIPVRSGLSAPQIEAMAEAIGQSSGTIVAYCRSGTRSTFLWALARSASGADGAELADLAARAGYDISPIRSRLR